MISFQFRFEKALSPFKRRTFKLYFWPPVSKNKFYNTISKDFPTLPHGILWLDVWWMIFFRSLWSDSSYSLFCSHLMQKVIYVPWHLWQNLRTGYEKLANLISVLGRSFWKCNRGTYIQFIMELEYWNLYAWLMI